MTSEKKRWKNWADCLRQEMMTGLTAEVTKSVEVITSETATTKTESTLRGVRFWEACQLGKGPNDFLVTAGFEIEFEQDENRKVQEVTLRLNQSWMTILQRVLDRKKKESQLPARQSGLGEESPHGETEP
jgi:hypothetical protein